LKCGCVFAKPVSNTATFTPVPITTFSTSHSRIAYWHNMRSIYKGICGF
jgi:hypothetical protein